MLTEIRIAEQKAIHPLQTENFNGNTHTQGAAKQQTFANVFQ